MGTSISLGRRFLLMPEGSGSPAPYLVVAMIEACLEHSSTEAMPGTTPGSSRPEQSSTEHSPGEAQQT